MAANQQGRSTLAWQWAGVLAKIPTQWFSARRRTASLTATVVAALLAIFAGQPGVALAYWSQTGSGTGTAQTDTLGAATPPAAAVSGTSVTLTWSAVTTTAGHPVTGYKIRRYANASGGTGVTPGGTCAGDSNGIVSATSCTDQGLTTGSTYYYTVTPVLNSWTGGESSPRTQATASGTTLTFGTSSLNVPGSLSGGSISGFFANETVTFRLDSVGGTTLTSTPSAVTTNGSGNATSFSVAVPSGIAQGPHTVYAVGSANSQAGTAFTVTNPSTVSFSNRVVRSLPGTLNGGSLTYFHASGAVHFYLDGTSGTPLAVTGGTDSTTVTTSGNGTASGFSVAIPSGTSNGQHTLWAVDNLGSQASYTIGVGANTFALSWPSGTTDLTAGSSKTLTITAMLPTGEIDTGYTGNHSLTFSGPAAAPKGNQPSYNGVTGTSVTTARSFSNGVATVPVILYKAETATLTVSDSGSPAATGNLQTTVVAASASYLCIAGNPSCTGGSKITIAKSSTWSSYVGIFDSYGNAAAAGTTYTVSISQPSNGSVSPTTLTVPAGATQSTGQFTYTAPSGNNKTDTVTASASGLTSATLSIGT
jgi:hypothetical protein